MKAGDVILVTQEMAQAHQQMVEAIMLMAEASNPVDQDCADRAFKKAAGTFAIATRIAFNKQDDAEVLSCQ